MCTTPGKDNLRKSVHMIFTSVKGSDGTHPNDQYSIGPSLSIKDSPLYLINLKPILAQLILEVEYRYI